MNIQQQDTPEAVYARVAAHEDRRAQLEGAEDGAELERVEAPLMDELECFDLMGEFLPLPQPATPRVLRVRSTASAGRSGSPVAQTTRGPRA